MWYAHSHAATTRCEPYSWLSSVLLLTVLGLLVFFILFTYSPLYFCILTFIFFLVIRMAFSLAFCEHCLSPQVLVIGIYIQPKITLRMCIFLTATFIYVPQALRIEKLLTMLILRGILIGGSTLRCTRIDFLVPVT